MRWTSLTRRAFTSIDLLVLVAIGVLLLPLLLAMLGRVKEQARTYVCVSNLRTIGTAANAYLIEYADLPWALPSPYVVGDRTYYWGAYTEFIWGGGRSDKHPSRQAWESEGGTGVHPNGSDCWRFPPLYRPMNRFIDARVPWYNPARDGGHEPRMAIPMELPGCFKCPSDSSINVPLVGAPNNDPTVGTPFTTWSWWGTSYPSNWWWAYYYKRAPPGNQPPYTGTSSNLKILGCMRDYNGELIPGLGKHMLKDKGGRWASRFIIFYENRLNYTMENARPRGYYTNPEPMKYVGWHGRANYHAAAFRDGSARYMRMDTRYVNGPGYTNWPNHPWEGAWEQYDLLNP